MYEDQFFSKGIPGSKRDIQTGFPAALGGEGVDGHHLGPAHEDLAEYSHHIRLFDKAAAQGIRRLPGDNHDSVARVLDIVSQVVQDAPALAMPEAEMITMGRFAR